MTKPAVFPSSHCGIRGERGRTAYRLLFSGLGRRGGESVSMVQGGRILWRGAQGLAKRPGGFPASADPVSPKKVLSEASSKPGKGIGERSSGSPRENRRRVLYFAVAKRHRGDTCLAVYFSTQEPRLKGACPQRFLVCAFCAAMAFDVWRRRVGAFHLAALSNEVLSYSHRHCFFGPDFNPLRFPSRQAVASSFPFVPQRRHAILPNCQTS